MLALGEFCAGMDVSYGVTLRVTGMLSVTRNFASRRSRPYATRHFLPATEMCPLDPRYRDKASMFTIIVETIDKTRHNTVSRHHALRTTAVEERVYESGAVRGKHVFYWASRRFSRMPVVACSMIYPVRR